MSITAFPVLARILKENGLIYTKAGSMAMGAAALNDAVAWCLLILAVSMANSGDMSVAGKVFACVFAFGFGLFVVFRPIFEKIVNYLETLNNVTVDGHLFALTLCFVLLCAWTTDLLGVDPIFGAFMFGLTVPRNTRLFHTCEERIEQFVLTFTLPLYFALSGLKTDVTQIHSGKDGAMVVLVCVVASFGKFIGAGGMALLSGVGLRESAAIAALMNTRGLVELIVLNLGLSSGILNGRTFTVMVLMALFTTFMTCPLIDLIYPAKYRTRNVDETPHVKGDATNYDSITRGDETASINMNFDTSCVSKDTRLGLIVDKVEYMQALIKVLACFLPFDVNSGLAVTVMHFIEPTNTKQDEFLALNEEGRLIRVDEETTDMVQALHDAHDPALKKPELLPVSMFCTAMDTQVKAFRIQGDPDEFPIEMRALAKHNECSLVLMPWRDSVYLQKLFWSSVELVTSAAFLLIVDKNFHNAHHVPFSRGRSQSTGGDSAVTPGRDRKGSIFQKLGLVDPDEDQDSGHVQMYSNIVERSPRRPTITHSLPKLPQVTKLSPVVVAVVTGCDADVSTLLVLLRFSENRSTTVYLLIPQDHEVFPDNVKNALESFRRRTVDLSNVNMVTADAISTDIEGLVQLVEEYKLDYFVGGFVEPGAAHMVETSQREQIAGSSPHDILSTLSSLAVATPETHEEHEALSVPSRFRGTSLPYPELGVLGCKLLSSTYTSRDYKMLIVHHGGGAASSERKMSNSQLMAEHLVASGSGDKDIEASNMA
eukprot:gene21266-27289_t